MDNIKRRIPLDEEFMDKTVDDIIFGALTVESTLCEGIPYIPMRKAKELYDDIARSRN